MLTSSFAEIIDWVDKLDFWEQAAFDLIVSGNEISDADIDLLVQYLLEDNNLNGKSGERPELKYKDYFVTSDDDAIYQLKKIANLRNINALAPNHKLEFGSNLTAIFGATGSGKSGYARVLGSAGFTRGDEEIIPDITKPFDPDAPQLVDIELVREGEAIFIEHEVGLPCPQLSSFYVFDATSVIVHLTEKNTISFSPAGLSYLQTLANLTDDVRTRLNQKIDIKKKENIFTSLFHEDSAVKELVSSISHQTDLEELKEQANFTSDDKEELKKLKSRINTIETKGIPSQIKELQQSKEDLATLITKIKLVVGGLDSEMVNSINQDIKNVNTHLEVANKLGLESFKAGKLQSVGTEEWHTFIHAAKDLASVEVDNQDRPYPQDESHCLLCQQPLTVEAKDLINQIWNFLGDEVQEKLRLAEQSLSNKLDEVTGLDTTYFEDQLAVSRLILDRDKELHSRIKSHRDAIVLLKESAQRGIETHKEMESLKIETENLPKIEEIVNEIEAEIAKWQEEEGKVENLQTKSFELEDKKLLSKHLKEIEEFIQELVWIDKASKIGGTTGRITGKYNQLFSKLVTDEYIELYEKTLEGLGRPLKVHISTQARKGKVYKQLVLEADESTPEILTRPDKILSGGEKRVVALADFLTEISLDTSSSGIILDDPVTSLDLAWRQKIAAILVEEAKVRQVIVFTHDMPFLYYLGAESEKEKVPIDNHWIKRGDIDEIPGHVYLNNSPALEKDYKNDKIARKWHKKALDSPPEDQLAFVKEGFGAVRTSYEVLIIFGLFNGVVMRFEERISFGRLKDVVWDQSIIESIIERCETCSKYIEGHSHSDAFSGEPPTPAILLTEIDEFNNIRQAVRELKKKS